MEWISVKDRLPKKDGTYLVYTTHDYIDIAKYATNLLKVDKYDFAGEKRSGWFDYDGEWGFYEMDNITHWMSLPESPKEN